VAQEVRAQTQVPDFSAILYSIMPLLTMFIQFFLFMYMFKTVLGLIKELG
jgi:positive regulator of sigma E activity